MRWNLAIAAFSALTMHTVAEAADPSEVNLHQIAEQNVFGHYQAKTGSNSVEKGFYADGSLLYIKAKMDNTHYAEHIQLNGPVVTDVNVNIKTLDLNYKWKPGFQVTLGYVFPEDQWDLSLMWNCLHSKVHAEAHINDFSLDLNNLRPSWSPFFGPEASDAEAHWSLHFNTLDLCLGRNVFLGRRFAIHPYAGLRGVWIKQNYLAQYSAFLQSSLAGIPQAFPLNTSTHAKTILRDWV